MFCLPDRAAWTNLIVGTIQIGKKAMTEPIRKIVNNLSLLIRKECPVIAVRWYEPRITLHRFIDRVLVMGPMQRRPSAQVYITFNSHVMLY
jgi:hypothetical protein